MQRTFLGAVAALAMGCAAHANGIEDGNAGLKALQSGDNDGAIALFTRALNSGQLKGEDREFAYANRGAAYLNKNDLSDAIADLDRARQLKPDDAEVQDALVKAISTQLPATILPGQSAKSMFTQFGKALGRAVVAGIQQGAQENSDGN